MTIEAERVWLELSGTGNDRGRPDVQPRLQTSLVRDWESPSGKLVYERVPLAGGRRPAL